MKKNLKKLMSINLLLIPSLMTGCTSQSSQPSITEATMPSTLKTTENAPKDALVDLKIENSVDAETEEPNETELLTEVIRLIDEEKEKRLIKSNVELELALSERPELREQMKKLIQMKAELLEGVEKESESAYSEHVSEDDISLLKLNNELKSLQIELAENNYDLHYEIEQTIHQKQAELKAKNEQFIIINNAETEKYIARAKEKLYTKYDNTQLEQKITTLESKIEQLNNGDKWEDE